jgi:hypothetical protein
VSRHHGPPPLCGHDPPQGRSRPQAVGHCEAEVVDAKFFIRRERLSDVGDVVNTSDTSTPTHNQISGLITQARAHQLDNQVSSFLTSYSSYLYNENMCSVLLLRNDRQERNRVAFASATFRFQNSSSLSRLPRPHMDLNSGVQILSGKLLESTFICIKPQVYIMSELATIIILMQRPFSANGAATPYFGPLGHLSC